MAVGGHIARMTEDRWGRKVLECQLGRGMCPAVGLVSLIQIELEIGTNVRGSIINEMQKSTHRPYFCKKEKNKAERVYRQLLPKIA